MDRADVCIFIGAPGSGKGTLSALITKQLGWSQLSTGNLFRKHIQNQTELGKQIQQAIQDGKLVDDAVVVAMVKEWLEQKVKTVPGIILDGFPRTLAQARALTDLLPTLNGELQVHVVHFVVPDEKIIKRLSSRVVCSDNECQAVYSLSDPVLAASEQNICDACGAALIRRNDDLPQTVRERLVTYHLHEKPLLDHFKNSGFEIKTLDGDRARSEIFQDFKRIIGVQ